MPAMNTIAPKIATRSIVCPLCGETHTVEHKHWFDENGRQVSERDAVLCAHFMAEYVAKAAQPFQLFRAPAPAQPAAPPPGFFVADWEGDKRRRRNAAAKARRAAKKAA